MILFQITIASSLMPLIPCDAAAQYGKILSDVGQFLQHHLLQELPTGANVREMRPSPQRSAKRVCPR
jgi:hypothetical protein